MPKTVIIGAGSGFGSRLSVDILSREALREGTIVLVDIDPRRNGYVTTYVQRAVDQIGCSVEVTGTTERREALEGADFVVTSFHVGGPAYAGKPYYYDIMIPAKHGVQQQVGDTIGPGAVARFLRTMPVLSEMLSDIQDLAPNALLLNYVNPMGMLTWAALDSSPVPFVGLCHSVQGTAEDIAELLDVPFDEFRYRAAGINHMSWYLEMKRGEEDLYPAFRKAAAANEEFSKRNQVCLDLMAHFGYFVAESSRHHSEYYGYFRKNGEAREHYGFAEPRKVDPDGRSRNDARWESERLQAVLSGREPVDLSPSNEFAAEIMDAVVTGTPARIYANVRNGGLIPNLPADCIVEVPTLVDHNGWQPCEFGPLPSQLAALNATHVSVQRLAVEAWKERSREKAIQAIALDPLTAAALTLDQSRVMANELLDSQPEFLGYLS